MDYENKIKQAELEKLIAEIEQSKAETRKIEFDREQLERPFYKKSSFVKTIIAGLVGGIAILGVFNNVIEPTYKKDIIKSQLKIAEKEKENAENKKMNSILNDSIQIAEKSIDSLQKRNNSILSQIEKQKEEIEYHEANNLKLIDAIKDYNATLKIREKSIISQKKRTIEIINDQLTYLKGLNKENAIHVQSIYFDYDRSNLRQEQAEQLLLILKFLNANKRNFNLEVNGYSYVKGGAAYNQQLSARRANVVRDYLISNGLSPHRVTSKGLGEVDIHPLIVENLDQETERKLYELKSVVQVYLTY
ncbi:hypothetical protein GCM10011344_42270 [Dokdonia pacifica]|uniref:OmpA family protein n=1 Tax=Dokdonia pacifica TaxID=1627892 RepID=A0A239DKK9_9FLAO|nr:OmpA family protein [Dokdonia pacifica]GGG36957.1 hypothetical protein GCM10011344_42270 [Dokdonia pacifica]SNS33145.1 OmpA family protein [Dokdonia pacifica]